MLVDIDANTEIRFTDNGWKSSGSFRAGENELVWTAPAGGVTKGTIVVIDDGSVTEGGGTVTGTMPLFSGSGDQLFVFQGTLATPTLLAGLQMNGNWDSNATSSNTSALPVALDGTGAFALAISPEVDNAVFVGSSPMAGETQSEAIIRLNDVTNWNTSNNTRFADLSQGTIILPITLQSFTATAKNNKSYLQWTTAAERNNDYMAVERSRDGKRFAEIGQVAGAGTTDVEQTYNFVDERPFDGINYYRLRQVDFDGKSEYHRVVSVLIDRKGEDIRIAPTAASDKIAIYLPQTTKSSAQMNIYDVTGKLWYTGVLPAGVNEESLDVSNLPNGHYILQVIEGEDVGVVRFNKL